MQLINIANFQNSKNDATVTHNIYLLSLSIVQIFDTYIMSDMQVLLIFITYFLNISNNYLKC